LADASRELYKKYFDQDNYPIRRLVTSNPIMIIGRRGSGKTDALLSAQLDPRKFDPIVYFKATAAARSFSQILSQVHQTIQANRVAPLVESVAELWRVLFWVSIIASIVESSRDTTDPDIVVLSEFTKDLGIEKGAENNPYHYLLRAVIVFREKYNKSNLLTKGVDFFGCFDELKVGGVNATTAINHALEHLNELNTQAIILFDSFEAMGISDPNIKLTLAGLLKCVGDFQQPGLPAHLRCCIPVESYFYFLDVSSNVLKDFQRGQILHWHAGELLKIAAIRYAMFIEAWEPESVVSKVRPFDFRLPRSIQPFWYQFLPTTVRNGANHQLEQTLPYLLRHTQLIPRQLLVILNAIISSNISETKLFTGKISAETIRPSVRQAENLVTEQILDSYKEIWPAARLVLEGTLPNFSRYGGNIISYSNLHKIFNASPHRFDGEVYDFSDYVRLLTELGVIGRLIRRDRDYAVAIFEYSEPHKLLLTPEDTVCVHPAFTEKFRVVAADAVSDEFLPVYPLGSDPQADDRRPAQQW